MMISREVITRIEQISPWIPKPEQADALLASYLQSNYQPTIYLVRNG